MGIYQYQPHITAGAMGGCLYFSNTSQREMIELAEMDGWRYVFAPEDVVVPEQPKEIRWQPAQLDEDMFERLRAACPLYRAISDAIQQKIRARYSADREAAFARLGASIALGMHELTEEERREFRAYDSYVEEVRQWGREERIKIGLQKP